MTPGNFDRRIVDRHLLALREAVRELQRHAGVTPNELRADTDRRWAIERGLQVCTQNALDIAAHLCATAGRDSSTYRSSLDCLVKVGVLPADFGDSFSSIAGFRNVLVHNYLDIDLDAVAGMLGEHLADFETFASHIEAWCGKASDE